MTPSGTIFLRRSRPTRASATNRRSLHLADPPSPPWPSYFGQFGCEAVGQLAEGGHLSIAHLLSNDLLGVPVRPVRPVPFSCSPCADPTPGGLHTDGGEPPVCVDQDEQDRRHDAGL